MSTTGTTSHPFASVTSDEVAAVRDLLATSGDVTESSRFVYVGLEEPARAMATEPAAASEPTDRRFRVLLHDVADGPPKDAVVSVTEGAVVSVQTPDPGVDGQLPVLDEEFELVEKILSTHPEWLTALDARGLDASTPMSDKA